MGRYSRWSLHHPLSLLGASVVTVSSVLILFLLAAELTGHEVNPYLGLLVFLVLPVFFVAGLLLIPIGSWLGTRREARPYPILDINLPSHRARLVVFLALTAVNLLLIGAAGYRGVEYIDSPVFCGQTCHQVMHPEYAAWQASPHARVACVSCHVGPGARGSVRAKLNGVSQLVGVITGRYDRPIPAPVQNLRPARETCERCHWPRLDHGDRLKVKTTFLEDEASTAQKTVLKLKVGGAKGEKSGAGIHWHMNLSNTVTYVATDATRQTIPWVRLTDSEGTVTEFSAPGAARPTDAEIAERGRQMDCVDCHNRPAHRFMTAEAAVDDALAAGRLPRDLPFMRKAAVAAVTPAYETAAAAEAGIRVSLRTFYAETAPAAARDRGGDVDRAAAEAALLYRRNVFPEMRIGWGAYPSMIGHANEKGCFRCHDGQHVSPSGQAISNDCETCHTLLAVEEPDPEILKQLSP
jgi:hypothetical protein